jgi:hypothetical protein
LPTNRVENPNPKGGSGKDARSSLWPPGWQLFDTPLTRRNDLTVKLIAAAEAVLLVALCGQTGTVIVEKFGWWSALCLPAAAASIFSTGPPARGPATGLVRVLIGVVLTSDAIVITAILLWGVETIEYHAMPRMFAAGTGDPPPSARSCRLDRLAGTKRVREDRRDRVLAMLKGGSQR